MLKENPVPWRQAALFVVTFALINVPARQFGDNLAAARSANLMFEHAQEDPHAPVRRDMSSGENLDLYWPQLPDARQQRLVLVVGMSQMYVINQRQPHDRRISELLDDAWSPRGVRAFGLAAPNLDNEEALLYLLAAGTRDEGAPYAMIYGVCFDKLRNVDVRPSLLSFMRRRPQLIQAWEQTARKYSARYPKASEKMLATLHTLADAHASAGDETFEERLRSAAARVLPVVATRRDINAYVYGQLYVLRNWALNIKNSSKRPIIGARYDLNRELFEILAEEAAARGVKLLPYIIPVNPTADTPYVAAEYAEFKAWFTAFAQRRRLHWVDLDALVPSEEWGLLEGQPDFKHFNGAAHRRTAGALNHAFAADLFVDLPLYAR